MANYRDSHIFALGGDSSRYDEEYISLTKVDMYTIKTDTWIRAPNLPKVKNGMASCTLGNYLYVIGGNTKGGGSPEYLNRLNA